MKKYETTKEKEYYVRGSSFEAKGRGCKGDNSGGDTNSRYYI